MLEVSLFLGFPLDVSYEKTLHKMSPEQRQFFVGCENSYLKEVLFEDVWYLGKFAGSLTTLTDLHLLEKNIYSILNKITPHYPYQDTPLILFTTPISPS